MAVLQLFLACVTSEAVPQNRAVPETDFGGGYQSLRPEQKRLVDDWFHRFSAVVEKEVDPAEADENLPLSVKTTFNAVTHAMLTTKLDASGSTPAATAIDLIDKLDSVAGEKPGAGGDQQFRMYVQMKPGALNVLEASKTFRRGPDNTVFHKGYPICYRGAGGTPSIQISVTRDGSRADIDVDYRSSRFPVFLLNGHLTAANSDVRAGNNDERHNSQWSGFRNWWRNLLGLPIPTDSADARGADRRVLIDRPSVKHDDAADAVHHFLSSWVVEQKPAEALAYVAEQAYACMELESGGKVDRGMAKFNMLRAMSSANRVIGEVSDLTEASTAVPFVDERLKRIPHRYDGAFSLYDVREDLAEQFNCVNKVDNPQVSQQALRSTRFGKYTGAIFRLRGNGLKGEAVATLWQKDDDYWKLISYALEPEGGKRVPDLAAQPVSSARLRYTDGDKYMTAAATEFLHQWLIERDIGEAMAYLSEQSLACANVYRTEESPAGNTSADLVMDGMTKAAAAIGATRTLGSGIVAVEPHHEHLKLVKHANEDAFVIVSIPEYMAESADCRRRKPGEDPEFRTAEPTGYGKYYATGFRRHGVEAAAALWIVWGNIDGVWKALSYVVMHP